MRIARRLLLRPLQILITCLVLGLGAVPQAADAWRPDVVLIQTARARPARAQELRTLGRAAWAKPGDRTPARAPWQRFWHAPQPDGQRSYLENLTLLR